MSYTHSYIIYIYILTLPWEQIFLMEYRGCRSHICSFFHNLQVLKHTNKLWKKLAIINKDVADLTNRCQEISWLQSELMKEKRVLETTRERKIVNQCNSEGQKMKMLQSLQYSVTVNIMPLKSVQRVTTHNISQSCPPVKKMYWWEIKNENVNKVQKSCFYLMTLSYIQCIVILMMSNC